MSDTTMLKIYVW